MKKDLSEFSDIHTHSLRHDAVVSISPNAAIDPGYYYSCGIHPWDAGEATDAIFRLLEEKLASPQVVAVGEAGIDLLRGPQLDQQLSVFKRQAEMAEKHQMPLIIHCVKGWNEIINMHRIIKPAQKWILHGYRGNPILTRRLLDEGFFFSIGERYNPESVAIIPTSRRFFETDDNTSITVDTIMDKLNKGK